MTLHIKKSKNYNFLDNVKIPSEWLVISTDIFIGMFLPIFGAHSEMSSHLIKKTMTKIVKIDGTLILVLL